MSTTRDASSTDGAAGAGGAGGNDGGQGDASVPPGTMATFPIKSSSNKRYLVGQNDVPFLLAGTLRNV